VPLSAAVMRRRVRQNPNCWFLLMTVISVKLLPLWLSPEKLTT
jgi:hypothetical protein